MSDDDWSPDGSLSPEDNESDYEPEKKPKSKRRRSSSKKKQKMSSDESADFDSPKPTRRSTRRSSLRKQKKEQQQQQQQILDIASSSDDNQSEQENKPIVINQIKPKPKKKRNSSTKKPKKSEPMDQDSDNEPISTTTTTKKKGRKRKSDEADLENPPSKKRRISNSKTNANSASNSNTNSSLKKKTKPSKSSKSSKPALLKGNEATERIKQYMLKVNRPHSKSSLNQELGKIISLGQCAKSLESLKEDGILIMKEFGKKAKSKIYWRDQDGFSDDEENEDEDEIANRLKELEIEIKQKRLKFNRLKKEVVTKESEPTDDELEKTMNRVHTEWKMVESTVKKIENNTNTVSIEDINDKLSKFYRFGKAWKDRRSVVYEMISQIFQDSSEKPDKLLTNKLNGETDKDNDVNWENYKDIYVKSARLVQQEKDAKAKRKR